MTGFREDRLLVRYSPHDVSAAFRVLQDLSDQLKKLQRGADRRRSRVRDQYRAILVRYVKQQTGKLNDKWVSELLNGALAPRPWLYQVGPDEFEREPPGPWKTITVEAHRRWRNRNKKLIDEPPQLEEKWKQDLQRKASERNDPRPQPLWLELRGTKSRRLRRGSA